MVARLPMLIFLLITAAYLWRWAYMRYGASAALMAVVLLAFSPTIMAHGRFVTTDMAAAWGVLLATFHFIRYLKAPGRRTFLLAALTLGLALLTKFSTFLLVPYFMLIAGLWALAEQHGKLRPALRSAIRWGTRTAVLCAVAFAAVVWPVYIIHTAAYPPERQASDTQSILANHPDQSLARIVEWMADKPVIRGAGQYGLGLMMVKQRSTGGNTIYWLGRVVKAGGPLYFPLVYFLKEPLAWWLLTALAVSSLIVRSRRKHEHKHKPRKGEWLADHFDETVMLLWLGIYWLTSVTSTLNIGVRHLLPVYPFTILLVSGRLSAVMHWLKRNNPLRLRWAAAAIAILMGWYVFESISVFPHYLTYFNQVAGGPSGGYRYVVDSNLDWGQDLKRLSQYLNKQGVERVELDYFGWADPAYYLSDRSTWVYVGKYENGDDFLQRNKSDGWIAVSGTFLQNSNGEKTFDIHDKRSYLWLTRYEPVAVIGNSIFVWHITE
jgi:4-amino-4-deoxy-L-arabinose transferase-like glycosyltransferase